MCQNREIASSKRRLPSDEEDGGGEGRETTPAPVSDFTDGGTCPGCLLVGSNDAADEDTARTIKKLKGCQEETTPQRESGRGELPKWRRRSRWDAEDDRSAPVSWYDRGVGVGDRGDGDGDGGFGTLLAATLHVSAQESFGKSTPRALPPSAINTQDPKDDWRDVNFSTPPAAATLAAAPAVKVKKRTTTTTTADTAAAATATALQVPPATTSGSAPTPRKRVYVGNLCYRLTELDVRALFINFGTISRVSMPLDAALGRHRGFAFIEFTTVDAAEVALRIDGLLVADR